MFPSLNLIGQTISSTPPPFEYINRIVIKNGVYDDFYATRVDESIKETDTFSVPESWDAATYLHAKFNGDIFSGNSDFGVDNTTNILIKRRVKGTYKWLPLFDIPADCSDDYNFVVVDKYAASKTIYEYAAVPIINGVEASYSITSCKVEFDDLVIIDKDDSCSTRFNIEMNQSRNTTCGTIVPIESKYPIYVANASNDYYSGNISATFIKMNGDNVDEDVNPSKYRDDVMSFLNNRKPKFIKHPNGNCWIASIGNTINDDDNGHPMVHHTSFDFTEIGNTESSEDLSRFGFVDIGEEWW
mgnify:CR=1 FL=1